MTPPTPQYKVLEDTVRTLLGVLQTLTSLDAVYLTRVDAESNIQETIFASGTRREPLATGTRPGPDARASEGLIVPWRDTLCWRTIEDGVPYTQHADRLWPEAAGIRQLNIRTYLSEPLRNAAGLLIGTLCALADRRVPITEDTLHVIAVFARLIAHHLDCTSELARVRQHNEDLASSLTVDPLTGVANRRGLMAELERALAHAARGGGRVVVAFIDLDRFKAVNDLYGHSLGDRFLVALTGRVAVATRAGETIARYGGDEFVVVGRLHQEAGDEARMAERFTTATRGDYLLGETVIRYAGASVGTAVARPGEDAGALLHRADEAMYQIKKSRNHGTAPAAAAG